MTIDNFWKFVQPVQFVILFTFIYGIYSLNFKKINNQFFIILIFLSLSTEIITDVLLTKKIDISLFYSIMFIVHNSFWLIFISYKFLENISKFLIPVLYFTFCILNLFFIEGIKVLNYNSFIIGSLIYCALFFRLSYFNLKNENFYYLKSTEYILLLAPICFFLGFSFLLAFRNNSLLAYKLFFNFELYNIVTNFSNYIYYGTLILYVFKEKIIKNET